MLRPEWRSTAQDIDFLVENGIDAPLPSRVVYEAEMVLWNVRHPFRARLSDLVDRW